MFCGNCGKEIEENSRFCEHCGHPVATEQAVPQETVIVPELPVSEQTILVPELPETEPVPEQPMDMPTIVVPQMPEPPVTQTDPLQQVYPDKPEKKKKPVGLIIGLAVAAVLLISIIVVVALGIANDWWRTPAAKDDDRPSVTEPTQSSATDEELTAEELRAQLKEFNVQGLNLYLSEEFQLTSSEEDLVTVFEAKDAGYKAMINVYASALEEEADIDSSREFANYYEEIMAEEGVELERERKHDIYYTVQYLDEEVRISGFYVKDGFGWMAEAWTDNNEDLIQKMIDYVTLGLVDEDFEAPDQTPQADPYEVSLGGLYLTVDTSFEEQKDNESAVYDNGSIGVYVNMQLLEDLPEPVSTSAEFAKWYHGELSPEDWEQTSVEKASDSFSYVLMVGSDGWTTMTGLYIHGSWCWMVTGETRNQEKDGERLVSILSSGRIEADEIPVPEVGSQTVEFEGMKLELDADYKEVYRDNSYVYMSGDMEVYIFTGSVAALDGDFTSAGDMALEEQKHYAEFWDNARLYDMQGVDCLLLWDDAEDAASTAYGYYMVGDTWWMIQVNSVELDEDTMLALAGGGLVEVTEEPFQKGELVYRDRMELTGQLTAEYEGLQISYSPDWSVDTTWGPAGDYASENMEMYTYSYSLSEKGVDDAISFAWLVAEEWYGLWEHNEVGMAGGVPYVLLYDEGKDFFLVSGLYANSETCWQIDIHCYDMDLLDQAIWYATAGRVLDGASLT